MTDQSEVEKVAKEFRNKYYEPFSMPKEDFARLFEQGVETNWVNIAAWHIREKEIAVLEARIEELANALYIAGQDNGDINYKNRYSSLQSRLAELRNNE